METQQHILRVLLSHVTVSHVKIWSFAQQCCYGKFMSPAAIQIMDTGF
jgi:hypothetical protein